MERLINKLIPLTEEHLGAEVPELAQLIAQKAGSMCPLAVENLVPIA